MKQKISFFETDAAKMIMSYSHVFLSHASDAFLGGMWVGFLWLFVMFIYQYYTYYRKAIVEDKKEFKMIYRDMNKKIRKIVGAFIIFLLITICLLCSVEEQFIKCALKGAALCAVVIPIMNGIYSDKKRFKFSY